MSKPKKLIHLGLHKTGTTLLQTLWAEMPGVSVSQEYCVKTVYTLRDIIWGVTDEDFSFPSDVELFRKTGTVEDPFQVFTAENISNPILSPFSEERLDLFHRYTPEVFGQLVDGEAQILLVVREPMSWLRSMYKQYIHEGGSHTFPNYLKANQEAFAYILSLKPILGAWEEFYGPENIVIMPYELMRDDPDRFFLELHTRTGLPADRFTDDIRLNVSVSDAQAELLRVTSRLMKFYLDNMPVEGEVREQMVANASAISDILRTELQRNPQGKMARAAERLGLESRLDVDLPEVITDAVRDGFVPILERHGGSVSEYLDLYRGAVH